MPHIIVEYSANLDDSVDASGLIGDVHAAVIASGVAQLAGVRTRAERRDVFCVGDGNPANAFVHVVARLRVGRSEDQRKALGRALLAAVEARLEHAFKTHPTAVTVEIHEFDHMTFRRNTVREQASAV